MGAKGGDRDWQQVRRPAGNYARLTLVAVFRPSLVRNQMSVRFVAMLIALSAGLPSVATQAAACPDTPHRFEFFKLFAPALARSKDIWVYLPAGYDCGEARYPVFVFNDGHDLFDWSPFAGEFEAALAAEFDTREGWYGTWRLAEQLERAAAEGRLPPMIAVGIASDDGRRSGDLVPVAWGGASDPRGVDYAIFVARTLVPVVDRRYRTVADRRCRGIGGASLGGVSALQIGLAHGDLFGMALVFSPVVGDPAIADWLTTAWAFHPVRDTLFLADFDDDRVGRRDRDWFAAMIGAAETARQVEMRQTPGGRHWIDSWADRVIPAMERLAAARCPAPR